MSSPVIIIPTAKYVANSTNKSNPSFKDYVADCKMQSDNIITKGRKRRLDHLTWEERIQRKKLKNRVAAQTSRDRKKAKMEEMESAVKHLYDKNDALMEECKRLREMNKRLTSENAELRKQLSAPCSRCQEQSRLVDCTLSNGPAVSDTDPLPQGQRIQSATTLNRHTTLVLLKIVLACLLYPTSSPNSTQSSTLTSLRNSLRAFYKISPQTWKQLLQPGRYALLLDASAASGSFCSSYLQSTANHIPEDNTGKVVGSAPEHLEPRGVESVAARSHNRSDQQRTKSNQHTTDDATLSEHTHDHAYSAVRADDSCITIIVADENNVPISEAVMEVVTSEPEAEQEPRSLADYISSYEVEDEEAPAPLGLLSVDCGKSERAPSDCGYESLDSPHSEASDAEMSELWNQGFSELFPALV